MSVEGFTYISCVRITVMHPRISGVIRRRLCVLLLETFSGVLVMTDLWHALLSKCVLVFILYVLYVLMY